MLRLQSGLCATMPRVVRSRGAATHTKPYSSSAPPAPACAEASPPSSPPPTPAADPLSIDYSANPTHYRVLRGEMNVFKTNPYSAELKVLWRFKDEAVARKSAEQLWDRFEGYRQEEDFVAWVRGRCQGRGTTEMEDLRRGAHASRPRHRMDVVRKFVQMGRTRSLRYALRPGGRKYDPATGAEMRRTGDVADEGKLAGAQVFEACLADIEADEVYAKAKEAWVAKYEARPGKAKRKPKAKAKATTKTSAKTKSRKDTSVKSKGSTA